MNNNKKAHTANKNGVEIHYRDREKEVLFLDLRQMGEPYEKKFVQFSTENIDKISKTYHDWQQVGYEDHYADVPEYCYSAKLDEIADKGFSLVPSKYIAFVNRDENIDYDAQMKSLAANLHELAEERKMLDKQLQEIFKNLGYSL